MKTVRGGGDIERYRVMETMKEAEGRWREHHRSGKKKYINVFYPESCVACVL